MKKITGNVDIENIKRCYVEGAVIKINCPKCGSEITSDFSGNYLSHPVIGEESTTYFCCSTCEDNAEDVCEYTIPIVVKSVIAVIEYDDTKIIPE